MSDAWTEIHRKAITSAGFEILDLGGVFRREEGRDGSRGGDALRAGAEGPRSRARRPAEKARGA